VPGTTEPPLNEGVNRECQCRGPRTVDGQGVCKCESNKIWIDATSECVCEANRVWDTTTNTCVCANGQIANPTTGVCQCPVGQVWQLGVWYDWLNRDNPSGWGDAETISNHVNDGFVACGSNSATAFAMSTQCVEASTNYNWDTIGYNIVYAEDGECNCANAHNPSGCPDLKVRFKCWHATLGFCECTGGREWNATAGLCQCPSSRGFVWNAATSKCICSAGRTPNTAGQCMCASDRQYVAASDTCVCTHDRVPDANGVC